MHIFDGTSGAATTWEDLALRASEADVLVLAEQHDDGPGHRLQAALANAILKQSKAALCMEMLERDEQPLVDAYLASEISADTLADLTESEDWGGKGQWPTFYQPLVDAAKDHGTALIAANAPRRLVRLARLEGFERLAALGTAFPGQYVQPEMIEQAAYAERFKDTMRQHTMPPPSNKKRKTSSAATDMPAMSEEKLEAMFRAQQVWDATMADSVVQAQREHGKAILVVGQFHTDFDGGLLLRMKAAAPELRILTISVQQEAADTLAESDKGRATYVVYRP